VVRGKHKKTSKKQIPAYQTNVPNSGTLKRVYSSNSEESLAQKKSHIVFGTVAFVIFLNRQKKK